MGRASLLGLSLPLPVRGCGVSDMVMSERWISPIARGGIGASALSRPRRSVVLSNR
jgi:hypothetical protein